MSLKTKAIGTFNPNGSGIQGNLFGLPYTPATAELVIVPVPWEVTVSYNTGTSRAPEAVLDASWQVDLCLKNIPDAWKYPVSMLKVPRDLFEESKRLRQLAQKQVQAVRAGISTHDGLIFSKVNDGCETLNIYIRSIAERLLQSGKTVGLLGGDHSTPLGLMRALADQYSDFGILQVDAHADLRRAYEGFAYSHGSIMYNALKLPAVSRLVQVGIRDYCEEELQLIQSDPRIKTFFDEDLKEKQYAGKSWDSLSDDIIDELPREVYISFDIDGLDPKLCPHTGTPVPGGLEFEQALMLIRKVATSGRRIIGFDLNEISPAPNNDWDANVGARLLYKLCAYQGVSVGKLSYRTN
jgi:agmatinase